MVEKIKVQMKKNLKKKSTKELKKNVSKWKSMHRTYTPVSIEISQDIIRDRKQKQRLK